MLCQYYYQEPNSFSYFFVNKLLFILQDAAAQASHVGVSWVTQCEDVAV